jgi:putative Mg2+ transporter-C (MgtC) family protein
MEVTLREVTYLAVVLRIFVAALFGGAIGLERGMKNRPAGLRTYMLVCVGSCLIMLTNQYLFQVSGAGDPMRLGAQVVSGIGFLGAGTIIVTKHNQIKGLTTAAGLWASAGVGLALGVGFYEAAVAGALAEFIVMTLLQRFDNRLHRNAKVLEVYFELSKERSLGEFLRDIRDKDIDVRDVQREQDSDTQEGSRSYFAILKLQKRQNHHSVVDDIRTIDGILYLEAL